MRRAWPPSTGSVQSAPNRSITIVRTSGETEAAIDVPAVMVRRVSELDGWMAIIVVEQTATHARVRTSFAIRWQRLPQVAAWGAACNAPGPPLLSARRRLDVLSAR